MRACVLKRESLLLTRDLELTYLDSWLTWICDVDLWRIWNLSGRSFQNVPTLSKVGGGSVSCQDDGIWSPSRRQVSVKKSCNDVYLLWLRNNTLPDIGRSLSPQRENTYFFQIIKFSLSNLLLDSLRVVGPTHPIPWGILKHGIHPLRKNSKNTQKTNSLITYLKEDAFASKEVHANGSNWTWSSDFSRAISKKSHWKKSSVRPFVVSKCSSRQRFSTQKTGGSRHFLSSDLGPRVISKNSHVLNGSTKTQ